AEVGAVPRLHQHPQLVAAVTVAGAAQVERVGGRAGDVAEAGGWRALLLQLEARRRLVVAVGVAVGVADRDRVVRLRREVAQEHARRRRPRVRVLPYATLFRSAEVGAVPRLHQHPQLVAAVTVAGAAQVERVGGRAGDVAEAG